MAKYKQTPAETETLVNLNQADLADGFFRLYSVDGAIIEWLRYCFGNDLSSYILKPIVNSGRTLGYDWKLPVKFLPKLVTFWNESLIPTKKD